MKRRAGLGHGLLCAVCAGILAGCVGKAGAAAAQPEVDPLEQVVDADMRNFLPDAEKHGTGFHIDDRGHVITAAHIVAGCRNIMVSFADAPASRARLLGIDARRDVALLHSVERSTVWFELVDDPPRTDRLIVFAGAGGDRLVPPPMTARLGPQFRSGPFLLRSFSPALERGASGGPVLDGRGLVVGMSVGTIREGGSLTLAVSGRDLRTFLDYMGLEPPPRRAPPGLAGRPVDRAGIAMLGTAIMRVDCA